MESGAWLRASEESEAFHSMEVTDHLMSPKLIEDLTLPQVILVESMWIHRLHGFSMDSMDNPWYFFWQ